MAKRDPTSIYKDLENHRERFRNSLQVKYVLDHLKKSGVLDTQNYNILADESNKYKAPDLLLDIIKDNKAIDKFVEALQATERYDTLLCLLTRRKSEDDDMKDTENIEFYKEKNRRLEAENKDLKRQLKKEKREKDDLDKLVSDLAMQGSKKDEKIRDLKSKVEKHENRITYLEKRLGDYAQEFEDVHTKMEKTIQDGQRCEKGFKNRGKWIS